jgi:hypothetical protein
MFYLWLWQKLPGNKPLKIIESAALLVLVLAILWFFVFPNIQPFLGGDPTFVE